MPASSTPKKPGTSTERVERMSRRTPRQDQAPPLPVQPSDPNGDDPAQGAIQDDRGISDRYGSQP
jgi:hypothetical protein